MSACGLTTLADIPASHGARETKNGQRGYRFRGKSLGWGISRIAQRPLLPAKLRKRRLDFLADMECLAMPINSRAKGAAEERKIARALETLTGISFCRQLEQSRTADHSDLIPSDPCWPFEIEIKNYAKGIGCRAEWQRQAERAAAKTGRIPCVIFRYKYQDPRVSVPLSAIGKALGQEWTEPGWAEITLEALAYLAGEIMAGDA